MEGTVTQTSVVPEHFSTAELYRNWGTSMFCGNPSSMMALIGAESRIQRVETESTQVQDQDDDGFGAELDRMLLDVAEELNHAASNADVTVDESGLDLELMILEDPMLESPNNGTSKFHNNPTSMIQLQELHESGFQRVETESTQVQDQDDDGFGGELDRMLLDVAEEFYNAASNADVTVDESGLDLERMILEEPMLASMFHNNPTSMIQLQELTDAESGFLRVETESTGVQDHGDDGFGGKLEPMLLDVEEFNYAESNAQDITVDQFSLDLERMIHEEPILESTYVNENGAPNNSETLAGADLEDHARAVLQRPVVAPAESIGVTYHKKNKQWEAHLWLKGQQLRNNRKKKGVQLFLGNFMTEDEAKQAHDRAAIKLDFRETARGKLYPLNFPESAQAGYLAEHSQWSVRDFLWKLRRSSLKFNKGKSRMKGVSVRKSGRKGRFPTLTYEAKICQTFGDGEKQSFDLGRFQSEQEAGMAYDRASLFFKGADELTCITNFRPSDYSAAEVQAAGSSLTGQE